jgi:hypothetical protein
VNDAEENEGSFEPTACICADNVSEKKPKKWGLRNTIKMGGKKYVK